MTTTNELEQIRRRNEEIDHKRADKLAAKIRRAATVQANKEAREAARERAAVNREARNKLRAERLDVKIARLELELSIARSERALL